MCSDYFQVLAPGVATGPCGGLNIKKVKTDIMMPLRIYHT